MLQMMRRILCMVLIAAGCAVAGDVDWLFENDLEKDYIPLQETSVVLPQDYKTALENYRMGN